MLPPEHRSLSMGAPRAALTSEEAPQRGEQFGWRLLRDEVAGGERAALHRVGPAAPDLERVGERALLRAPVDEHRAADLPPSLAVLRVHLPVDVEGGTVVRADPRDGLVVERRQVV